MLPDPTPWKSIYLLDDQARVDLKKTTELAYYIRSICMDYVQRFPEYASSTQHVFTSMTRGDSIQWTDAFLRPGGRYKFERGWMFKLRVSLKDTDPMTIVDYLREFDVHCADFNLEKSYSGNYAEGNFGCYMFAKDFPIMLMYRRMGGLDNEPGKTRWTTREG